MVIASEWIQIWSPGLEGAVFENFREFSRIFEKLRPPPLGGGVFENFRKLCGFHFLQGDFRKFSKNIFKKLHPPPLGGGEFSKIFVNFAVSTSSGPTGGFSKIFENFGKKFSNNCAPPLGRGGGKFSKMFENSAVRGFSKIFEIYFRKFAHPPGAETNFENFRNLLRFTLC